MTVALQYKWRTFTHPKLDMMAYEICRSNAKLPWTVLIFDYSKVGDEQLFSDLFYCQSWDEKRGSDGLVSDDVKFCINLWEELGLGKKHGSFTPRHLQHDRSREPSVYRAEAMDVLKKKFGVEEFIFNKV